jgi:NAD(P)-dependent dehydrogenase (short-subunit alcohol dehydrogenase family)
MLKSKVAVITGASKGIGREIALGLAKDGYHLVMISRSDDLLNELIDEVYACTPEDVSVSHSIYALDVTNNEEVKNTIMDIIEKYGRIDILVNCAGIYYSGTFNLSVEDFEKMIGINLTAPFVFMKEVIPVMKKQKEGYIFNISSRAGKIGFAEDGGYVASKFGLVGLNESAYRELSSSGIKFTAICPGWTNTGMAVQAGTPLQGHEMIQPSDILKTIKWLLSVSPSVRIKEVVIECQKSIC